MKKPNLPYQILSEYLKVGDNKYQIGKNLKIPTSQVCYHLKKIKKIIDLDKFPDFKTITDKLLPTFRMIFGGFPYEQAEFYIDYLFYYVMNEYYE